MTAGDPATILQRTSLWLAALGERGQVEEATAARLNETLADSFGEGLDREDDPLLVVMLCGPTAVGKSSLINALAGADISRPGLGATTRAAVLYVHENDDPARLFQYSQALAGSQPQATAIIRHRRDELLHKVLVDTPDIDSVMLHHRELTARLVHAADLVLFVASPEKYKVLRSARWIFEQRQQRAMAFVLNKWDRQALGLQHERRDEVATDFADVLAGEGFAGAIVFKVSALTEPDSIENDLPALRAWLEAGISQSTAATMRQRRLRAAWGRLAAAIEPVVPRPLSDHPALPGLTECLAGGGTAAEQRIVAEASALDPPGLEDGGRPITPGLLGMWSRTRNRITSATASLRSGLSVVSTRADTPGWFGERTLETVDQFITEARTARLPFGPVGAAWSAEVSHLKHQLRQLPLDVATELMSNANRPTLRRVMGIASIYAVEALIILILLVTVGRAAIDFVNGNYAPAGLALTVLELILILLIIGNIISNLFFPPLRQRLRRVVSQRARSLVRSAVQAIQTALRDHVAAVDRLAQEGRDLLHMIDKTVTALIKPGGDDPGVDRLFGQTLDEQTLGEQTLGEQTLGEQIRLDQTPAEQIPPEQVPAEQPLAQLEATAPEPPARRRPAFD